MKIKKISSDFTRGFSRVLDMAGTKRWPKLSDSGRADYEAIKGDWENVGKTIECESDRYRKGRIN